MIINRYRASSLKAAIEKANAELGSEAKILHVRQLSANNSSSDRNTPFPPERIEIIAVVDDDVINKDNNANNIDLTVDDDNYQEGVNQTGKTENLFKNNRNPYGPVCCKKYSSNQLNQEILLDENTKDNTYYPSDNKLPDKIALIPNLQEENETKES